MKKNLLESLKFRSCLILALGLLCLSCNDNSKESNKKPLVESNRYSSDPAIVKSDVTSVNLSGDNLYLGMNGDCFIEVDPRTNNSVRYELPSGLKGIETYYVHSLGQNRFLVSKRDNGLTYVEYDDSKLGKKFKRALTLKHPIKGQNYSSYRVYPFADSLWIATTNGLLTIPTHTLNNVTGGSVTLQYVKPLEKNFNGRTEFVIRDIRSRYEGSDTVYDVYTKTNIYRLLPSKNTTEIRGFSKEDSLYVRGFENWYVSQDGDSLICLVRDKEGKMKVSDAKFYIGGLGINVEKGSTIVVKDSILYFVAKEHLNQMYLPNADLASSNEYEPLLLAAWDNNGMYLVNKSGLYSYQVDKGVKYLHPIASSDNMSKGIVYDNEIYTIDSECLYKITPADRWNPYPQKIKPEKIANVTASFPKRDEIKDQLTCIGIKDDTLYIGSRNAIYTYDLSDKRGKGVTRLKDKDTKDNPNRVIDDNTYFTSISYPFAGTLHSGIYRIEGDSITKVHPGQKNIKKLIYNDSLLACMTNTGVSLYKRKAKNVLDSVQGLIPSFKTIMDIALTKDSLYVLTSDKLNRFSVPALEKHSEIGQLEFTSESNPGYTALANIDGKVIPYSDLSVVDGNVLKADPVNWIVWWLVIGIGIIALGFLVYYLYARYKKHNLKEMVKMLKEVEAEMKKIISKAYEEKERLTSDVAAHERTIAALNNQINEKVQENQRLTNQVHGHEATIAALNTQINEKAQENQRLTNQVHGHEVTIAALNTQINEKAQENQRLTDRVNGLNATIKQQKSQIDEQERRNSELVSNIESLRQESNKNIKLIDTLKNKNFLLTTEKETLLITLNEHISQLQEYKHRIEHPEFYKAKELLGNLKESTPVKEFMVDFEYPGNMGELRSEMREYLNALYNADKDESNILKARQDLLCFSKLIHERFVTLLNESEERKITYNSQLSNSDSSDEESRLLAEKFIYQIDDMLHKVIKYDTNNFEDQDKRDLQLIIHSLSIIKKLEDVYNELNQYFKVEEIKLLSEKVLLQGDKDCLADLTKKLDLDRLLISTLNSTTKGCSSLLDESKKATYRYLWNGFFLLSLTEIEPKEICQYLNATIWIKEKDPNQTDEPEKNVTENLYKQLWGKNNNAITRFFEPRVTNEIIERQSFMPSKLMDLVFVSCVEYFDRLKFKKRNKRKRGMNKILSQYVKYTGSIIVVKEIPNRIQSQNLQYRISR